MNRLVGRTWFYVHYPWNGATVTAGGRPIQGTAIGGTTNLTVHRIPSDVDAITVTERWEGGESRFTVSRPDF